MIVLAIRRIASIRTESWVQPFVCKAQMEKSVESVIRRIHETLTREVIYVTRGATTVLSELAEVPGASRTLLTCSIPYSQSASDRLVGKVPSDSYSVMQQAIDLSRRAYKEPAALTDQGDWEFISVSAACALATDRPKGAHYLQLA